MIQQGDVLEMVLGNGPGTKHRIRSKIEVMTEDLQLDEQKELVVRGDFVVLETDGKLLQKGQRIEIHYDSKYEHPRVYKLSCKSKTYGLYWILKNAKAKSIANIQKEEIQKIQKKYNSSWMSSCSIM